VIELERDHLHAWQLLGENFLKVGDVTQAMKSFDQSLRLDPDAIGVYYAMAETHSRIRDYQSAQEVLQEAALLSPQVTADVYFRLGYLYERSEQPKKAISAYEEGLLLDPKRLNVYFQIARIYQDTDSDYLALLTLENANQAGLQDASIYLEKGRIYFTQKRWERALTAFMKAYEKGSLRARDGIENVANTYWNQGKKERSEDILRELKKEL
jgi:tetratricopeptide (TPR) repeat protein